MTDQDFSLPLLNPDLKLYQASSSDGEPGWNIHNPVANTYFKIGWAEFECLARFPKTRSAQQLKWLVETQTALRIDLEDIKNLVIFLHSNGLLALSGGQVPFIDRQEPFWKKALHGYLYFTIPLFRPDAFLRKTLPFVRPLLSRTFIVTMMILFVLGAVMTAQRLDEFMHSFTRFFSLEGVVLGLAVLWFVKFVHEFSHAYTAAKYGVPVPHMGVALIVMYPVLYTETTGGWRLASRKARFHIGAAGILAELCLAAVFLILWNIMPAGSIGQSLAFTVVAVALISSLLVNLNPLMRFDGYYMMSDLTGIENLQQRACNFARWKIRKMFFALHDDPPEAVPEKKQSFLTGFGLTLLVYRFFLFVGISVLVYHVFFKPLGLILMLVELVWFIGVPIFAELKIWWERRSDILQTSRSRLLLVMLMPLCLALLLPWQTTVSLPAVLHAENVASIYPYAPSRIEELLVKEGQPVKAGDVLARLSSFDLSQKILMAWHKVGQLKEIQRSARTDPALLQSKYGGIDLEIETAQRQLEILLQQEKNLLVTSSFSGVIRDLDASLQPGRYVRQSDLLFRVVGDETQVVTGYVSEDDRDRFAAGNEAVFIPDGQPFTSVSMKVLKLAPTDADALFWPELASLYNGTIPAEYDRHEKLVPLRSIYQVDLIFPEQPQESLRSHVLPGTVRVDAEGISPFGRFIRGLSGLFLREIGLN